MTDACLSLIVTKCANMSRPRQRGLSVLAVVLSGTAIDYCFEIGKTNLARIVPKTA